MSRRRNLRLPSSSDEDEEAPIPPIPNPNPNPSHNPNPNPIPNPNSYPNPSSPPPSPPHEISDDDDGDAIFLDAADELPDPSPPSPNANSSPIRNPNPSVDPIDGVLKRLGLSLRREWLESCVGGLETAGLGFERLDSNGKAKLCFEQFLLADMNYCGAGILPANVSGMHQVELEGPFVLQVDELVNICARLRERYHNTGAGFHRCLKLSLTDGVQRVFGMEYRPIKDLDVVGPAGLKIIVRNVHIRRGLIMLVPEVLEILGGMVEDLEAARERLVLEIDKPPRGRRRNQRNAMLPLAKRASLAAWPSATADNGGGQQNFSAPQGSDIRAATSASSRSVAEGRVEEFDAPDVGGNIGAELAAQVTENSIAEEFIAPHQSDHIVEEPPPSSRTEVLAASFVCSRDINTTEECDDIVIGLTTNAECPAGGTRESIANDFVAPLVPGSDLEEPTNASRRQIDSDTVTQTPPYVEDTNVLDAENEVGETEHPLILTGDRELPFTYMACLFARWTTQRDQEASIRGKIKCTLTGVKGFQFKHRSTYELHVYVDDGSLISEVVIDHHVVEKGIGHSPMEVTAALSSVDKKIVTDMKEAMKKFQLFLSKFEGIILVEINANSTFPVALEMNQACSTSDAWMLLRRLKKFTSPHKSPQSHLNPIDLSP